jgi:hypothetical protein
MNQNARRRLGERGNYEVGYRRPPVHSRFQPGRSGNPRGRPRRLMPTANDVFSQELYRTVEVREGGKVTKMPLMQAVFRAFIAAAAKGNGPALRSLMPLIQEAESIRAQSAADAAKKRSPREIARAIAFVFAQADAENEGEGTKLLTSMLEEGPG